MESEGVQKKVTQIGVETRISVQRRKQRRINLSTKQTIQSEKKLSCASIQRVEQNVLDIASASKIATDDKKEGTVQCTCGGEGKNRTFQVYSCANK